MFYNYSFFHSLFHPSTLTTAVSNSNEIRGYKRRVFFVLLFTLAVFAVQNIWGMGTSSFSHLFATNDAKTYFTARMISFIATLIWAGLFFIFHYFFVSLILFMLTEVPQKWIRKVQLYVVATLMIEKLILFIVFYIVGYATNLNFFSVAPLVAKVTNEDFVLFALNQLTIFSVLTIIIQYTFIKRWMETSAHKQLLTRIIGIHVLFAIIIGLLSALPLQDWIVRGLS